MGDNKYITTNKQGDIRTYNKLDGKVSAKNLIPSFNGDAILSVDSSKDGNLFLLTFKNYLMLMPTILDKKSAFEYTFRKEKKPGLIQLQVRQSDLMRHNLR